MTKWLGWPGAILVALYLIQSLNSGPSMSELLLATQPVLRVPLDTLGSTGRTAVLFRVPQTREWNRLRRAWGEPSHIAFATGADRHIKPYRELGMTIRALVRGQALPMNPVTEPPYGYSSRTTDYGVAFRAPSGAEVRIDVEAPARAQPPDGELVIEPQWPGASKDRIVSALIEESFRPYVSTAGGLGVVLTVAALLPGGRRSHRH